MKLNFDAPINNLSFGNVSMNLLREMQRAGINCNLFCVGDKADVSAFDQLSDELREYTKVSGFGRLKNFDRSVPTLKLWHINGSERKLGDKQYLFTFHETDTATEEEVNIVKAQEHVFFSSSHSVKVFKNAGCDNVSFVPLGFDEDFKVVDTDFPKDVVHFGLIGKWERRKNTTLIIQTWLQNFGNNPKYQLSCLVNNPFLGEDGMQQAIQEATMGKNWSNLNFIPSLKTNSEVNLLINSFDIDLSGLSNGEGWNLPAFNASALGKWSVVSNYSSHKDWATKENCVLVEPSGTQPCYDGLFFKKGLPFNQGSYALLHSNDISDGMREAVKRYKENEINENGLLLQKNSYSYTLRIVIDRMINIYRIQ